MERSSAAEMETFFDANQKTWSGRQASAPYPKDASIGQVALHALAKTPNKVIQLFDTADQRLTCQSLAQYAIRAARYFKLKLGLQQEDVIGIMANNTTFLTPIVLGAFLVGAPINPIHYLLDRSTVKHIFGLTKPKVVFCDEEAYGALIKGLDDIGCYCKVYTIQGHIDGVSSVQEVLQEIESESSFLPESLRNGGDQCAAILCSSGTTGLPKGVCLSHRNLLNRCTSDFSLAGAEDVFFTFSTLYWISAILYLVRSITSGALRIITDQPFSPELFLELVEKHKVTQIIGAPSQAAVTVHCPDICRRDLSSIRNFILGGSPVLLTLSKKIRDLLGPHALCEAYGCTEFGGLATMNKWPHQKEGSAGRLTTNTQARIISENGKSLGIGETGEILLRSPYKWTGYYGNAEMTQHTVDSNGWIRTGDLGYFDTDGFLFICGRGKDTLKCRGFQISPIEIEEVIQKIPGVIEVCVFGIPDEVANDLPAAAIIKSTGCNLTEEHVHKAVADFLSETKQLHGGVYFIQELPKTPSGKVQRQKLLSIIDSIKSSE